MKKILKHLYYKYINPVNKNIDIPDERDYKYEILFWNKESKSFYDFRIIASQLEIYNQSIKSFMRMSCGSCGITHLSNAMNICEYYSYWRKYNQLSPETWWLEYLKINPEAEFVWSTLQQWLKWALKEKLISGYSKVVDIELAKNAIDNNRLIYTGSLNWDWNKVEQENIYWIKDKSYWHLFCIVWYNKDWFIWVNSWWPENWYFIIPYNLWDTLYTRYVTSDQRDELVYQEYKKTLLLKNKLMWFYKEIFERENPNGSTVFNDLEWAVDKCIDKNWNLISEEFFYLVMIWLERIKK